MVNEMNDNIKTPAIRFKGLTDTWEQFKLGDLGNTQSGIGFPESEQGGQIGIPFYKVSDMNTEGNENEMVTANHHVTSAQIARRGWNPIDAVPAIMFAKVGAAVMLNRKRLISKPFLLDNNTMAYSFGEKLDTSFGKTLFDTIYLPSLVQVGALPSYNETDINGIEVKIPKLDEQAMIGLAFDKINNLITLHQRKHEKLQQVKKTLLEKMFPKDGEVAPKIRFKGFKDAWEQHKLGAIGSTYTGLSGKSKEDFGHGEAQFVTYMNVFSNPISNPETVESVEIDISQNQVQYGDIFFTTSSETPEEVGMSSVWLNNAKNTYLNSFCFGYRPTTKFDLYFLGFMLRSPSIRKDIVLLAQGISRYNISKTKVMDIRIPIPNPQEQERIGSFMRHVDQLITLHQHKHEKLQNIKKALLQKMFV